MKRLREIGAKGSKTLYGQLLSRSLFVLAALLLLIGAFQYFLMRGFLYQNQAETLEAQFRSIPPIEMKFLREAAAASGSVSSNGASGEAGGSEPDQAGKNAANVEDDFASAFGAVDDGTSTPAPAPPASGGPASASSDSSGSGGGARQPGDAGAGNAAKRRAFLFNGLSLAEIGADGAAIDLNAEYGVPAPVLTPARYGELRGEAAQPGGRVRYVLAADANGTEQLLVLRPIGGLAAEGLPMLQIGSPTGPLTAILWRQLAIFGALAALALAGGLALYRPVLRRSLSPLSRMVGTVAEIDAGRLGERFAAQQGQAEIDRLASSFNGMLERLEEAFAAERESQERMRRFIADASHELRTPLTSIRGFLEVLLRGSRISEEQLRGALRSMHGESQRMTKLVEDLLSLVKLDGGPELHLTPIRPAALLAELEDHLRMLAGEREVALNLEAGESAEVSGDADKLKQIVLNLFGNAVQHTDAQAGRIALNLSAEDGRCILEVQDNGPGIPPELRQKVFERFYRSDESRSRRSGGAGLGLAISLAIAEAHGGTIELDSVPGQGSSFRLVLPTTAGSRL
ncbi:two-component sensor histidine kinase [Saccharibacillus sp. O23]|uniref:sensor histidine kinase n=1 Tax=Saccharibacillus sp. O23 TaxID=2009338 RepID=UPI000B4E4E73|nr:HAMP domain-containing sensor histidine kinase [Saccharibacillus sp. O23]OWR28682.1 two-component sensor histidine kinase [Saccharibacillus sp. O23]